MTNLIYKSEVTSTNEEILDLLINTPEHLALYSFNQTKGRGQYGNVWNIQIDKNLAYTFAIKTKNINIDDVSFNYRTALITRDYIAKMTKSTVNIKWPNDLILNQKKICGILIEKKKVAHESYFIIGIGINILQENYDNLPKAGSILTTTGQAFNLKSFTKVFHDYFKNEILKTTDDAEILNNFNRHLFRKNEISVFVKDDIRQNGIIKNADADGYLWIDFENDGLQRVFHKQVELLY
ncbi:biotin--[acetyl-CoA-carboxylase] ligase [Soonwooa sp.]|uniref:biotin--[acetyl-CoA-carboxylase] ligase n=1 Tax=Soonwooa sp. TaxID=1938592 RepID=UPI0028ABDBC2|nr:biotin--[acetyl-CoA-carboxylase] ligase [Soonwooa sp.]